VCIFFNRSGSVPAKMMLILFFKLLLVFSLLLVLLDKPPAFLELFFDLLFDFFVASEQLKHFLLVILGFFYDREQKQKT
jgi:hypothetical protein